MIVAWIPVRRQMRISPNWPPQIEILPPKIGRGVLMMWARGARPLIYHDRP